MPLSNFQTFPYDQSKVLARLQNYGQVPSSLGRVPRGICWAMSLNWCQEKLSSSNQKPVERFGRIIEEKNIASLCTVQKQYLDPQVDTMPASFVGRLRDVLDNDSWYMQKNEDMARAGFMLKSSGHQVIDWGRQGGDPMTEVRTLLDERPQFGVVLMLLPSTRGTATRSLPISATRRGSRPPISTASIRMPASSNAIG